MIYLDNAATTRPKPPGVAEAVTAAMDGWGNCGRGVHPEALAAARASSWAPRPLLPQPSRASVTARATHGGLGREVAARSR